MQFTLRKFAPTRPDQTPPPTTTPQQPPPPPAFIKTNKPKVSLRREPFSLSPWRLPFLNRAPQWFRTYTHLSIVGFTVVGFLQWWQRDEHERERIQMLNRPRVNLYARPSYTAEDTDKPTAVV